MRRLRRALERWHRRQLIRAIRAMHDDHDSECMWWHGDVTGTVDMQARCLICRPS